MEEIPVYLFTGFMDSGKTSLILETLLENDFTEEEAGVIIACEDGEIEYDKEQLEKIKMNLVTVEDEEEYNAEFLQKVQDTYHPQVIFLEWNGTWELATFQETKMPKGWVLVQSLATVDATTFEMYLSNMRAMIMEQIFDADVVIFNRCDDDTPREKFRRNVKALNRKAQIVYERKDGTIDQREMEDVPFDTSADFIELSDADYGLWYLDAMDNPKKYDGKTIKFLALVYNPPKMKKGTFVPGRFAMTCCVEDITFIGFKCKYADSDKIPHKSWIEITAKVKVEFAKEYRGKGPVLYPTEIKPATKPEDELVYFN